MLPRGSLQREVEEAAKAAERGEQHAAERLRTAQAACARDAWQRARAAATTARWDWLHANENPNPAISAMLRPPQHSRCIPALRDTTTGALISHPQALANTMAKFWADISAEPQVCSDAMQRVLDALRASGAQMDPRLVTAAGNQTISMDEVTCAVKRMASGRAPGIDGLPVEAYRMHLSATAPILAALYSAIGNTQQLPQDFQKGAITFMFKKGERLQPANYRPITLLNTDYKVLARILATRLTPALAPAVSREQCAYIPGRRGGEVVWLLKLLPEFLRLQKKEAAVVFTDFAKAFDTVSRPFLFAAMKTMGAGDGFTAWARLLLSDTKAVAVVNGHISQSVTFMAGVRQGCPLSPLLYLFIAQALLAWLDSHKLGVQVQLRRITAAQYADDCTALLNSVTDAPRFEAAMQTFAAASGQRLNSAKTQLLRIGNITQPLPANIPFQLVQSALVLGIRISNSAPSDAELQQFWQPKLDIATACLKRVDRMPLSAFGKALAASGYALSTLLYHAEYMGLPPPNLLQPLEKQVAAVVDGRGFGNSKRKLTGIAAAAMPGAPGSGGLGLIPLQRHIAARNAWWGLQLLTAPLRAGPPAPWVVVARKLLGETQLRAASPLCMLWHDTPAMCRETDVLHELRGCPSATQLFSALRVLPRPQLSQPLPPPGPWCHNAPLWSNPLITDSNQQPLEWSAFWLYRHTGGKSSADYRCRLKTITTVGELAQLVQRTTCPDPANLRRHRVDQTALSREVGFLSAQYDVVRIVEDACHAVTHRRLRECLDWCRSNPLPPTTAPALELHLSARWHAEADILGRLVFRHSSLPTGSKALTAVKVCNATAMQVDPAAVYREPRMVAYITEACRMQQCGEALAAFLATLRQVWALRWENTYKEVLWRLAVDGVVMYGAARFTAGNPLACWCACGRVSRTHLFWECCIAIAVRTELQRCLPATAPAINREHLWLLCVPSGVSRHVWHIVALAALDAIHRNNRYLTSMCLAQHPAPAASAADGADAIGHDHAHGQPRARASQQHLSTAASNAVETFWSNIHSFTSLHAYKPPNAWSRDTLISNPTHPYIRTIMTGEPAQPKLCIIRPP
jgi:hypothetical protein